LSHGRPSQELRFWLWKKPMGFWDGGGGGDSRFLPFGFAQGRNDKVQLGMTTFIRGSGAGFAEGVQDDYAADGEGDYGGQGGDQCEGWVQVEDVGEDGGYGEEYACGVQAERGARRGLRRRRLRCGAGVGAEV
jgi:hypothetical protein